MESPGVRYWENGRSLDAPIKRSGGGGVSALTFRNMNTLYGTPPNEFTSD